MSTFIPPSRASVPIYMDLYDEMCEHNRLLTIGCYECCEQCNHDNHQCQACGDPLRHDGSDIRTGQPHGCFLDREIGLNYVDDHRKSIRTMLRNRKIHRRA